jgi:hypothetical protein
MSRTLKLVGLHFALAAMLLRALLPTGWMPNPSGSAMVPLVICTMNGPVRMMVPADGQPNKHSPSHEDGRQHEVCPFAAAVHFAVPVSSSTLAPSSLIAGLVINLFAPRQATHDTRYSPQSPRAPPMAA